MPGRGPVSAPAFDLSPRDRSIVQLVARFKQAASSHIQELLFNDVASHTSANRALVRLTERGYLARIEKRLVGGSRGGSGQYVYQLGRRGFYLYFDGRFSPWRTVNYHALGIVETYIVLRRLERAGVLYIVGMSTEPDSWVRVGGNELKPDLYVEVERAGGVRRRVWFEIDMGSEGQSQLRTKLLRYWQAYDESNWDVYPGTIWVAVDAERAKEISWLISQMPTNAHVLFQVSTLERLPALFGG
jgi:hypothetical protein